MFMKSVMYHLHHWERRTRASHLAVRSLDVLSQTKAEPGCGHLVPQVNICTMHQQDMCELWLLRGCPMQRSCLLPVLKAYSPSGSVRTVRCQNGHGMMPRVVVYNQPCSTHAYSRHVRPAAVQQQAGPSVLLYVKEYYHPYS